MMMYGLVQRSRRLSKNQSRTISVDPGAGLAIQRPGRGMFSVRITEAAIKSILAWRVFEAPKVSLLINTIMTC